MVCCSGEGLAIRGCQLAHHCRRAAVSDIPRHENAHRHLEAIPRARQPEARRSTHLRRQLRMAPEMATNMLRVRTEVEHRAHALHDGLQRRIIWELEGEV